MTSKCNTLIDQEFPPEDEDIEEVVLPVAFPEECTCRVDELMAISAMNVRQVARELGTNKMTVGRWLKGKSPRAVFQERIDRLYAEYRELLRNDPEELSMRVAATLADQ